MRRAENAWQALGDFAGPAYLRYSFTRPTEREVDAVVERLAISPGDRALDVGCGPGRHAHALARRGFEVVGVDISARFVAEAAANAPAGATFVHADAAELTYDADFDAVISLCQGAFGTESRAVDRHLVGVMARALRPGGRLALGAFSEAFVAANLEPGDDFDAGCFRERSTVLDAHGQRREFDLVTVCYRPEDLCTLLADHGLCAIEVLDDHASLLAIAEKRRCYP